ncbi:cysteine-rich receptor-like protein kinase 10 [Coffea eugenioides]|uniref:cysteine-rich receptor-like protein kinase 10 n=1 Tax=Coffea eugenioides TaxID=49369 RepID=UPI000F614665|nr:cysteine-rich receptor-like protein kinase 10 [Coffea eugenioides]
MIPRSLFRFCCILGFLSFSKRVTSLTFLARSCQNTTYNPKANSAYSASLNFLLSSLSSNASHTINGFYNSTAGHNISDKIYGLFLCQGDLSSDICEQCVADASNRILKLCSDEKTAIVWYDECLLRYSNESMFSREDASFRINFWSGQNVTRPDLFNPLLLNLMNNVTNQAANDGSGKKFAVEEANFSSFQRLYTLAQCTPDLSSFDCMACLSNAVSNLPSCCYNRQGGRVVYPSCNVRYELYRFYNIVTAASNLPPLLPWSTPSSSKEKGQNSREVVIAIVVPIIVSVFLFFVALFLLRRRLRKRSDRVVEATGGSESLDAESLQYNLNEIQAATNNFSACNRIGEGGSGRVYKGTLHNGQDVAVKRLSTSSLQGFEEFRNEIGLVANLHHRNLVRLLGYCFHGEEKLLIYEFVPNKSLDYFLFDPERQPVLDWSRRYNIIGGLARGLLYLHDDSRLRIVHRDLKASNVLLDESMNPKIADFGYARICAVDQSEGSTSKIAGTYGYMAPEYAMRGQFSVKSDVFSFGVLVLEIISGKRSGSFHESDSAEDLLSYAWKQWRDGTPVALLDRNVGDASSRNEVIQCIHIGLLCVQEDAEQRPNMAAVVLMLNSYSATMPAPNQPPILCHSRT